MIKKIFILLAAVALVAIGGCSYVEKQIDDYVEQSVNITEPEIVTVKSGSGFQAVLSQFESKGWIRKSRYSSLIRWFHPELTKLKAGTFQVQPGSSFREVLLNITKGKEHQFSITFVEGSRFSEWRALLAKADRLNNDSATMTEAEIASLLGIKQSKLEGFFLAETYYYTAGTSDLDILKRSHQKLANVLDQSWKNRQKPTPLKSPYEALILASIIEKETAVEEERGRVSSVFINRLNKGMRLQTDPTVIYGMGDKYTGTIYKKDLRTPTPYNTYTIYGLPPTPIAMAGKASIVAALNPDKTQYLYFVASGKGGHVFSKNLKDHNKAVQAYRKQLRNR